MKDTLRAQIIKTIEEELDNEEVYINVMADKICQLVAERIREAMRLAKTLTVYDDGLQAILNELTTKERGK